MSDSADAFRPALVPLVGGKSAVLPIPREEFDKLQKADDTIAELTALQEKYAQLFDNFVEFETTLATLGVQRAYVNTTTHAVFFETKQTISRRISNVLSAARAYIDQSKQHLRTLAGEEGFALAEAHFATEYNAPNGLGYRVMEALRNFSQHYGLPVGGMSLRQTRIERTGALEHTIEIWLLPDDLRRDRKFKVSVLAELDAIGPKIALTPLLRSYVEALSMVNTKLHHCLDPVEFEARTALRDAMDGYQAAMSSRPEGLYAVLRNSSGNILASPRAQVDPAAMDYLDTVRARTPAEKLLAHVGQHARARLAST